MRLGVSMKCTGFGVKSIVVVLGFFDDFEGRGLISLVMLNAGVPLGATPEPALVESQWRVF